MTQDPSNKPKKPTQSERIQQVLDTTTTTELFEKVRETQESCNHLFEILERSRHEGEARSFAEEFANPDTGGVSVYGTELPMLDGFKDLKMDASLLGGAHKKYQAVRKSLATALEHASKLEQQVQADTVKRVNQVIKKQKGGKGLVQNFQRTLRVQDLQPFSPGTPKNTVQFGSNGVFVVVGLELPAQVFDVAGELSLIGDDFSELHAQKLLQAQINAHVAKLNDHAATIGMATGVDPLKAVKRSLHVQAKLWHGTASVSPRQWTMTLSEEGIKAGDRKMTPLVQSDYSFEGAAEGKLTLLVQVGYRIKVKRSEVDDVIAGLSYLPELALYHGVEDGMTLAEFYADRGLTLSEDVGDLAAAEEEDAAEEVPAIEPLEDEETVQEAPAAPATDDVVMAPVPAAAPEEVLDADPVEPQETATQAEAESEPDDGEMVLF